MYMQASAGHFQNGAFFSAVCEQGYRLTFYRYIQVLHSDRNELIRISCECLGLVSSRKFISTENTDI